MLYHLSTFSRRFERNKKLKFSLRDLGLIEKIDRYKVENKMRKSNALFKTIKTD